ncbi:MAG: hypothetical protein AAGG75_23000 [Bacteroidota bacterium]
MKKLLLLALMGLLTSNSFSQTAAGLAQEVCHCLDEQPEEKNNKIEHCVREELGNSCYQEVSDTLLHEIMSSAHLQLNRYCSTFIAAAMKEWPDEALDSWKWLKSMPASSISEEDFAALFEYELMYYFEADGKLAVIKLDREYWEEWAEGGKYFLKYNVEKIKDKEFGLTVGVKNWGWTQYGRNRSRDRFRYRVLSKEGHYYRVAAAVEEGRIAEFKLYYHHRYEAPTVPLKAEELLGEWLVQQVGFVGKMSEESWSQEMSVHSFSEKMKQFRFKLEPDGRCSIEHKEKRMLNIPEGSWEFDPTRNRLNFFEQIDLKDSNSFAWRVIPLRVEKDQLIFLSRDSWLTLFVLEHPQPQSISSSLFYKFIPDSSDR